MDFLVGGGFVEGAELRHQVGFEQVFRLLPRHAFEGVGGEQGGGFGGEGGYFSGSGGVGYFVGGIVDADGQGEGAAFFRLYPVAGNGDLVALLYERIGGHPFGNGGFKGFEDEAGQVGSRIHKRLLRYGRV